VAAAFQQNLKCELIKIGTSSTRIVEEI